MSPTRLIIIAVSITFFATGTRAPLFYDLPPCVKALEYAKSERAGG